MACLFIHRYRWGFQIRGDERGFLEKAKEYKLRGISMLAVERTPSLERDVGENVYTSLSVGYVRLPVTSPMELLLVVGKATRCLAKPKFQRPVAVYAYNQDPENLVTGFVFKLLLRVPLVVVYHHVSELSFASIGEGIAARRRRGYGVLAAVWRSIVPALNRASAKGADVHLALSKSTKTEVERLIGVSDCEVVGNGLDTTKFRPMNAQKRYDVAFLGRVVHQKGVDTLLRAWAIVTQGRHDSKLVVIGGADKADRDSFIELGRELNVLDSVEFKGFLEDKEIVKLFSESRLFVFPSRKEGFAQAVSQAMACGLCAILSDIPSLREVYGDVAVFVPPDSPERLAESISELLTHPEVCREKGEISRRFVQKFDWGTVVEREITELQRHALR
jgi:glycosyltransferase involved in cell wall biosynthesis